MPRLSLWKSEKSHDYKFLDKTISEMFTVGATDLYIHKYLGTNNDSTSEDLTQPVYDQLDPKNIQDLLFLENRDKKYDQNIYRLRGHYNVQNLDFDLSQFGLFLTNDIIFVTVHYNDMIDIIGRKLMVGDVFELPHLTDYHPLNDTIPIGLRRYYQITDANYASEGFSSTWYPHLWRIKCEPLVNSQEFKDILKKPTNTDTYIGEWNSTTQYQEGYTVKFNGEIYVAKDVPPIGTDPSNSDYWEISDDTIDSIISTYKKNLEINQAVIDEAARLVPKIGYDRKQLYVVPTYTNGEPAPPINVIMPHDQSYITGIVELQTSSNYNINSYGIRIKSSKQDVENTINLKVGSTVVFSDAIMAPERTSTGSGPVAGDPVLTFNNLGLLVTPYGTVDNTYITSDQYRSLILTALNTNKNTDVINVLSIPESLSAGLLISITLKSVNGTITEAVPTNTRIVSINMATKQITVDKLTASAIPEGTAITVGGDFSGTIYNNLTYLSDSDPRFRFIKRQTPQQFGYIAGYNSGDGEAPNGEQMEAGIVFPAQANTGDYFLRIDFVPQKLFRFNGKIWVEISRNVRTSPSLDEFDQSMISSFINNNNTVTTTSGQTIASKQSLSKALRIKAD